MWIIILLLPKVQLLKIKHTGLVFITDLWAQFFFFLFWKEAALKAKLSLVFGESVLGWFWLLSNSTEYIHICMWRESGKFFILFSIPLISVTLDLHPPRLLKMSNTAAYDWSSSTDLHLWFKCQESSPILKCTVVIRLSDLLVWSQERAVVWMYLAYGLSPSPTPPLGWWRAGGETRAHSRAFSSNQDLVYQSLETAPSVAWQQCAISYCILKTDCLLCV